ncbi:hypothetical protein [Microbacterium trichothecenolyticum]|uniref:Uncharacterized protein n=1 Tax=Microbacterium trichothecenolyticum TaxID=69370 RepID=A0ABU0TZ51_MICTR|nr:hypothetical protein [Microbacterium trichothecenolyticum]MDQ1124941.1 hypothetical protein [Microbacterium trichothecenolyticum]
MIDPRPAVLPHSVGLLDGPLARVLTTDPPGEPLPPGPRVNAWHRAGAVAGSPGAALIALVEALWHPGEPHRASNGTETAIPRRPVPSAGACYPVQTHLVVDGARWVYDHDHGVARRRDPAIERAAGWPGGDVTASDTATLVFTVQPGRSFGRYRHRAWPLWIADAAYALAALEFVLGRLPASVRYGPSASLRTVLAVPRAAQTPSWTGLGLAPEIPLVAVDVPSRPELIGDAVQTLAQRRSPSLDLFLARAASRRPTPCLEDVARASGQAWVRGAAAVRSWSVRIPSSPAQLARAVWTGHLAAARLAYAGALRGADSRPVSGLAAQGDRWIFHALAFLDPPGDCP